MPAERRFLPYARQLIDEADIAAVGDVLRSAMLTTGPEIERFETALATEIGAAHAVACSNGTAALHLVAMAFDLGPGDTAIVPAVTFLATANVVRLQGAEVVFADVDPDTALMTAETLAAAIEECGKAARVAFPVHMAGQSCDMAALGEIARRSGIRLVEDACHALGSFARAGDGRRIAVGSCADADFACFSMHAVKTIAMGEGGAVTTNDPVAAERLRRLRNHGMVRDPASFERPGQAFAPDARPNPWYYEMPEIGLNYRLTDIQCALGRSQLGKLAPFVAKRQQLVERYDTALRHLSPRVRPLARRTQAADTAWHLYVVLIDFDGIGLDRATVMSRLRDRGVGTQVHYIPLYRQPYYEARYGARAMPGAERYYARALSLPLFPAMTEDDVDYVAACLEETLDGE
jgi:UDP-4-amino-4,6-dideoxy-N-acetyl-beta-L-altrosamine transaminase